MSLKKKLQVLKQNLRMWNNTTREAQLSFKIDILRGLGDLDNQLDCGVSTSNDMVANASLLKAFGDIDRIEAFGDIERTQRQLRPPQRRRTVKGEWSSNIPWGVA